MNAGLRALLTGLIDYAGLFPPAKLPLDQAVRNYLRYRDEPHAWMLGRFVMPAARLHELEAFRDEIGERPLVVSALATGEDDPKEALARLRNDLAGMIHCEDRHGGRVRVDTLELCPPAGLLWSRDRLGPWLVEVALAMGDRKLFVEVPVQAEEMAGVCHAIQEEGPDGTLLGVKLRCGGLEPAAFPSSAQLAAALTGCLGQVLPFKATAGLHHPFPRFDDGVKARMHGFINLFAAGVFIWHQSVDSAQAAAAAILDDDDPGSFRFDDSGLRWRGRSVSVKQIASAREAFALSFGSCSFDEPREDLRALGWL